MIYPSRLNFRLINTIVPFKVSSFTCITLFIFTKMFKDKNKKLGASIATKTMIMNKIYNNVQFNTYCLYLEALDSV